MQLQKLLAMHQLDELLKKLVKEAKAAGTKQPEGKACFENLPEAAKEDLEITKITALNCAAVADIKLDVQDVIIKNY